MAGIRTDMFRTLHSPAIWAITLAAAGILMVTMGIRQSFGLFIAPIDETTGLGVVAISFALAVGQFTWGAIQPVAGAVADRYGPRPVLLAALLVLAIGCAATTFRRQRFRSGADAGRAGRSGFRRGEFLGADRRRRATPAT